ncbi:metastasis-associated in colon cancer protein 1 [Bufo gargarizans]|uniref:metastasis-associated in colon cancer protein 1 n=1 Tax=Bufo gargarizans TaxID=30331 RepID=UPI001CF20F75|nr:metastasis-associated in colon cancer protein 1 [Bufo gargarizans]XP_044150072.1 metastasis-associated in colon cancer protein 1 [Bufo gargarizans]
MSRRQQSFRSAGISRSKSEGNLIDLDGQSVPTNNPENLGDKLDLVINWSDVFQDHSQNFSKRTNPFWNGLSESNPFLDDVAQANTSTNGRVSILKEDPFLFFRDIETRNSVSSSGDELDIGHVLEQTPTKRSGRSKSVSYLDDLGSTQSNVPEIDGQILAPDLEWLQNDREAYKMAWLSHRQLTRSCLDLDVVSQSPGWGQTQASDTHIFCRIDHNGGSVQLPNSDITVHVPEGHVKPGEFQDISLKAFLDPPALLNNNLSTTVSPLLEITLSNINTGEDILLEIKIAAEVKNDPYSQVMTDIATFYSYNKEGPFEKIPNGYIYNNMLQIKLPILSRITYIVCAAQTKSVQNQSSSVYDYIHKSLTVAVYGPKHIHPAFTTVLAIIGHNYTPEKLTVDDIKRRGKNLPPLVFQLWGKHQFVFYQWQDLLIHFAANNSCYSVKAADNSNEIKLQQLKAGKTIRAQFPFSLQGGKEISTFLFTVQIKDSQGSTLISEFPVSTPDPAQKIHWTPKNQTRLEKRKQILSTPVMPIISTVKYPKFQDKTLKMHNFAVTLKTVLRQQKIDYFLEYFKGDTIALLGEDKIKAIGQTKVKEWYVGVLRGKVGLVHCKNVKLISKDQVIDFSDVHFSTKMLLEQIALPFKKLTYIYSSVLSNVSDKVQDWRSLADALGYSHLSLDDLSQTLPEKEPDRVSCVVKRLKEDCHGDSKKKKFHYELIMGLLKIDCQGLVARLTQDTVILTTAVQLGIRWRELAEKLARLTKQQIEAYEIPHHGKSGEVNLQMMWKPAFDFLYTWAAHYGDSYRDVLQDLHCALDRMKYPVTRQWRELTGTLIFVNCLEVFQATSFSRPED